MRGSNPRLLAHKTNTLPTELMELPMGTDKSEKQRGGQWCIGNIEASQALAPGSTPGWRSRRFLSVFLFLFLLLLLLAGWPAVLEPKNQQTNKGKNKQHKNDPTKTKQNQNQNKTKNKTKPKTKQNQKQNKTRAKKKMFEPRIELGTSRV